MRQAQRVAVIERFGKPCLRCGWSLDDAPLDEGTLVLTCPCGVKYSAELVEGTDADTWARMFAEDGYKIDDDGGDTLTVTVRERDTFEGRLDEARRDAKREARLAKGTLHVAVGVMALSLGVAVVGAMLLWGAS